MSHLDIAQSLLLKPFNLELSDLNQAFSVLNHNQIDYADLYFQYNQTESFSLEESQVKAGSFNIDQGVGIRAVSGEKSALAYSDDISLNSILDACKTTRAIAQAGQSKIINQSQSIQSINKILYVDNNPIPTWESQRKIDLLYQIDDYARSLDSRVQQVMTSIVGDYDVVLVARNDGLISADVRPLVRLSVSVIMTENGQSEQGSGGGGGRFNYDYFTESVWQDYVKKAIHQADINLQAKPAPAGEMTVVLGSGWSGVLLHEAVGHGLEGDFNRKGSSAFSGKVGQQVASKGITIVDDGTIPNRRGSLNIDDEGNPTECTTLIENGILTGYMQDSLNARLMNTKITGNARRESFAHLPMPRMTNTYMLNGDKDPQEIISSIDKGIYAVNLGGGQVDITNGNFVFSASEAYYVEKGKIQYPVKGCMLIGNGPNVIQQISMIGNDMKLDDGVGTCGKDGQSVPVGVGQPTLKIEGLTIGGTGQ